MNSIQMFQIEFFSMFRNTIPQKPPNFNDNPFTGYRIHTHHPNGNADKIKWYIKNGPFNSDSMWLRGRELKLAMFNLHPSGSPKLSVSVYFQTFMSHKSQCDLTENKLEDNRIVCSIKDVDMQLSIFTRILFKVTRLWN